MEWVEEKLSEIDFVVEELVLKLTVLEHEELQEKLEVSELLPDLEGVLEVVSEPLQLTVLLSVPVLDAEALPESV